MTEPTDHALDLHLARCACGFVISARTIQAICAAATDHCRTVEAYEAREIHDFTDSVCSPDPVAAKLLLGAR